MQVIDYCYNAFSVFIIISQIKKETQNACYHDFTFHATPLFMIGFYNKVGITVVFIPKLFSFSTSSGNKWFRMLFHPDNLFEYSKKKLRIDILHSSNKIRPRFFFLKVTRVYL
jgi:hypothetical protein